MSSHGIPTAILSFRFTSGEAREQGHTLQVMAVLAGRRVLMAAERLGAEWSVGSRGGRATRRPEVAGPQGGDMCVCVSVCLSRGVHCNFKHDGLAKTSLSMVHLRKVLNEVKE